VLDKGTPNKIEWKPDLGAVGEEEKRPIDVVLLFPRNGKPLLPLYEDE
jgi:hypothetical protein